MTQKEIAELYRSYFEQIIKESLKDHIIFLLVSIPVILMGLLISIASFLVLSGFTDSIFFLSFLKVVGIDFALPLVTVDGDVTSTADFRAAMLVISSFGPLLLFFSAKGFLVELWFFVKLLLQGGLTSITDEELESMVFILSQTPLDIDEIKIREPLKKDVLDVLRLTHFILIEKNRVYRVKELPGLDD